MLYANVLEVEKAYGVDPFEFECGGHCVTTG